MYSLELEILDQLLGGDLPLNALRDLFPSDARFTQAVHGLLLNGDVQLRDSTRSDLPKWWWQSLFGEQAAMEELSAYRLHITDRGIRRIA